MEINADLHAHSAYAGGARGSSSKNLDEKSLKRFSDLATNSPLKGVNLLGTGDCQFKPWLNFLNENLVEDENGIFKYKDLQQSETAPKYVLQTEVILTGPVPNSKKKKKAHLLFYFPNFTIVDEFNDLLDKFKINHQKMARPFVVTDTVAEVETKLNAFLDLDKGVEMVPAHIMTPEGVFGSNTRINYLDELFGNVAKRIHAIETGLSADPSILGLIPELDSLSLISNADAHSGALNRVAREFTTFNLNKLSYSTLISAIRTNKIVRTAEFHPTEGRYFLTGHRAKRKMPGVHLANQFCYFSPKNVPENDLCPICDKEMSVGVLQRALEVSKIQGGNRKIGDGPQRSFVTMVPLIEVIGATLGISTLTSKKVLGIYQDIIDVIGTEINLWSDLRSVDKLKNSSLNQDLVENIIQIQSGNFCFVPGGYDGVYGKLRIGETLDFQDVSVISI
ncbi:MAG: hypothetical protein IH840_01385 [Candidatus Heimdallarchaeota archaeon]|nr:hypothetical protein [Candidatus Heimdallarchaeota archaeon]